MFALFGKLLKNIIIKMVCLAFQYFFYNALIISCTRDTVVHVLLPVRRISCLHFQIETV